MDAKAIADKYITKAGGRVPTGDVVWAPVRLSDKEQGWLKKAVMRGGYVPTRDRDGDAAPFLSELRSMHERGLIRGMPWRITKFGRDCLRELEAQQNKPAPELSSAPPAQQAPDAEIRPLADVEREAIERAIAKFKGNKSHAARALGISVRTIRNKVNAYQSGDTL